MPQLSIRNDEVEHWFDWDNIKQLGAGTFGEVFRAKCIKSRNADERGREGLINGKEYAVKVLKKDNLKYPKHWKNVAHEIEILKRVQHSACIGFHDAFQSQVKVFIVLELVDGGELFDVIIERSKLTENEANYITKQIVEALVYLHSENIVHRDLKPENILINKNTMRIKLIDFGFAKFFGKRTDTDVHLAAGNITNLAAPAPNTAALLAGLSPGAQIPSSPILTTPLGSLKYLAPEILRGLVSNGVAPRVTTREDIQKLDIFAVGVVAYVMLGGAFPFSSKSKAGLATQIEKGIKFPDTRWADISETARDFCQLLLHPDRKQRPTAVQCLNNVWLRAPAPNVVCTPIDPDSALLYHDVYNAMRKEESKLDKVTSEVAKTLIAGIQQTSSADLSNTVRVILQSQGSRDENIQVVLRAHGWRSEPQEFSVIPDRNAIIDSLQKLIVQDSESSNEQQAKPSPEDVRTLEHKNTATFQLNLPAKKKVAKNPASNNEQSPTDTN